MSAGDFRATLLGIEYTDREEYEKAARGMGYTHVDNGRRSIEWKVGTPVRVQLVEGGEIGGQVWSKGPKGWVWLALADQTFAAAECQPRVHRGRRGRQILVYRDVTTDGAHHGRAVGDPIGRIGA